MIARVWRGRVATEKIAAYVAYVARYHPEDDEYLTAREATVNHFMVEL